VLIFNITPERGLVRVTGEVPNGHLVVSRRSADTPDFQLRGGDLMVTTQGFSLEDSEAPIGVPVTYTATSTPTNRLIQRNLVLTPDFTYGQQTWTTGTGRTISAAGRVSANTGGTGAGIPGRTIGEVGLGALQPNTQYLVTGQIRFITPDVWTWEDVRNVGTWAQLRAAKATWEAVRSTQSSGGPVDSYTSISISLSNGTTNYVAPLTTLILPMNISQQWTTFSAYVTTPAVIPSNARLRIMHGTNTREYAAQWDLGQVGMMTRAETDRMYNLFWFSGDTPVPSRPQDYLMQSDEWEAASSDSFIGWEGSPGTSVSRFFSPSVISLSGVTQINVPEQSVPCEPVLLSDPVSSAFAQWFGLAGVDTITRNARLNVLSVLDREDYIGVSSKRALATGQLTLFTDTLAQRAQAINILRSGRILLLRNPDPRYPETNWYLAIGDVEESRDVPDARDPHRVWTVPFAQVLRPTGLIEASSGTTWQQIKDSGMTWAQLRSSREDWLDVLVTPA
jgi:hypothetical protein